MALKRSGVELVVDGAASFYKELGRADSSVVDFGRAATRAGTGVDTLGKAADKAEAHVGKLGQIATGAMRQLGSLAVDGALRLAQNVLSIGPAAVSAAADFEQGMDNIGAVAGATADEMAQVSRLALQLGKDTSFSASQASAGIEELIKGGVSIADVMDGAAQATLDLAAAGGVDLASAAEIAANALAIFNLEGSDMAMVANQIAGAANASSLSVTDFKFSMSAAGSVMAATGQDFTDLAQSIAVLGANGIKGSDAGTSLKTMFMNLQPQTKAQTAAFRELNLLTADGVNAFINLDGSFKSAAEVAGILQNATKDLTEAQRIQKLETIFGSDAVRAATIFVKEGAAGFDAMAASMGKVTAASVAAERLDNLRGDIDQLGGSMETAGIVAGTVLLPALRKLTQTAIKVVNASIPLIEAYGPDLVANLGKIAGFIADNLVPALYAAAAASAAYGLSLLPVGASLTTLIPLLYAKGAALTASLGPFALVAIAAFGAVKAYDAWSDGLRENVDRQMEASDVMQDVAALQERIAGNVRLQTPEVMKLNAQIDAEKQKYAELALVLERQAATGVQSQGRMAQAQREGTAALAAQEAQIVATARELDQATVAAQMQADAQERIAKGLDHSTGTWSAYSGGVEASTVAMQAAGQAAKATAEEIADANKVLLDVQTNGANALRDVVAANLAFQSDIEVAATEHWATLAKLHKEFADATTKDQKDAIQERINAENTGYATSQSNAAAAYAAEQGANRAHLGQLLIDTVNAWQTLGKVPAGMAESLRTGIAEHFGVAGDSMSLQFGRFLGVIQGVADGTGVAVGDMGTAFGRLEQDVVTSSGNMAASQEAMIANIVDQYNTGKLTWEQYTAALANVPATVNTLVTSNVPAEITYWQNLGKEQGLIAPLTQANIESNADTVAGQIRSVTAALNLMPSLKIVHIQARVDKMLEQHSPSPIENVMSSIVDFTSRRHVFDFEVKGIDGMTKLFTGGYADDPRNLQQSQSSLKAITDLLKTGDFSGGIGGLHEDDAFITFLLEARKDATALANVMKLLETGDFIGKSQGGGIFGLNEDHAFIAFLMAAREGVKDFSQVDLSNLDRSLNDIAGIDFSNLDTDLYEVGKAGSRAARELVGGFVDQHPMEQIAGKVKTGIETGIPGLRGATASMVAAIIDGMRPLLPALAKYSGPDLVSAVVTALKSGHVTVGQEGEELARVLMAPIQKLRKQGEYVGVDFLYALVEQLAKGEVQVGAEGEELARAVLTGLGLLPEGAESLGRAAADALTGGFFDRKPMEQIADKIKTMLGQTIPRDAIPYAGRLGEDLGAAMGEGAVKKLKTILGQGIPGAVADVSKALQSDKNRSSESKAGKSGNLGDFVTQGEGHFGAAVAEAGAAGAAAAGAFAGLFDETLTITKPVMITQFGVLGNDVATKLGYEFAANSDLTTAAYNKGLYAKDALMMGFGRPILQASIVTSQAMAGGGTVAPPASSQQILRQSSVSNSQSFSWSGNMIMPPGTTAQQGDAFLDYVARRGG